MPRTAPCRRDRRAALARLGGLMGSVASAGWMAGCGSGGNDAPTPQPPPPPATGNPRTWRLGFGPLPPRLTVPDVLQTVDLFSQRAELLAIHEDLPWKRLLAGDSPQLILDQEKKELVAYCRAKGLQLVFMVDATDGLDRSAEASALRTAKRSLAEPEIQALHMAYVQAVATQLKPEYLGLAAETNLVRVAAPAALYGALRQVAASAAAAVTGLPSASGAPVQLYTSVQVEMAWGRLGGNGTFLGIAQDRTDFPFAQALGLSSYPYFAYATPEEIPADHYSRVLHSRGGAALPAFVAEGGWPSAGASANGTTFTSSPELQELYIRRHAALLDSIGAIAYLQLTFTDIDLATFTPPLPANLPLFASLGLVDAQYRAKPALGAWDALHRRPRG